jgi:C-5 cytosine-specific DNA methylase
MQPLAIDLFCGLGGWTEGLLAEGYYVVGFDNVQHVYGEHRYPAQLVIQDVLTLHGRQFKDAALIVASPPCQPYSWRAMPWKAAKAAPPPDNSLFEACFRIQREASEAAGRYVPMVVENVFGAQKWVGRSRWNYGSFHLWGDVPALMPMVRNHRRSADWIGANSGSPTIRRAVRRDASAIQPSRTVGVRGSASPIIQRQVKGGIQTVGMGAAMILVAIRCGNGDFRP